MTNVRAGGRAGVRASGRAGGRAGVRACGRAGGRAGWLAGGHERGGGLGHWREVVVRADGGKVGHADAVAAAVAAVVSAATVLRLLRILARYSAKSLHEIDLELLWRTVGMFEGERVRRRSSSIMQGEEKSEIERSQRNLLLLCASTVNIRSSLYRTLTARPSYPPVTTPPLPSPLSPIPPHPVLRTGGFVKLRNGERLGKRGLLFFLTGSSSVSSSESSSSSYLCSSFLAGGRACADERAGGQADMREEVGWDIGER